MEFSLSPELNCRVQGKLALGIYRDDEEVLQAAFKALDAQEKSLTGIAEGYGDFQAGRYRALSEADAEFRLRRNLPQDTRTQH